MGKTREKSRLKICDLLAWRKSASLLKPHSSFTSDRVKCEQHLLYRIFSENNAAYLFRNEFFFLAFKPKKFFLNLYFLKYSNDNNTLFTIWEQRTTSLWDMNLFIMIFSSQNTKTTEQIKKSSWKRAFQTIVVRVYEINPECQRLTILHSSGQKKWGPWAERTDQLTPG